MGIDQEGEVWILAGRQSYIGNAGIPSQNKGCSRNIHRPIQLNEMAKNGTIAKRIYIAEHFTLIETLSKQSNKKSLHLIKPDSKITIL
jgi:hypothetical protein